MKRIPDVLDCWFESGSMPYGQDHFMKTSFPATMMNERSDLEPSKITSSVTRNDELPK